MAEQRAVITAGPEGGQITAAAAGFSFLPPGSSGTAVYRAAAGYRGRAFGMELANLANQIMFARLTPAAANARLAVGAALEFPDPLAGINNANILTLRPSSGTAASIRITSAGALEFWAPTTANPGTSAFQGTLLAAIDPTVMYWVRMLGDTASGGTVTAQVLNDPTAAPVATFTATGLGYAGGVTFTGTDIGLTSPNAAAMRIRVGDFGINDGTTTQLAPPDVAGTPPVDPAPPLGTLKRATLTAGPEDAPVAAGPATALTIVYAGTAPNLGSARYKTAAGYRGRPFGGELTNFAGDLSVFRLGLATGEFSSRIAAATAIQFPDDLSGIGNVNVFTLRPSGGVVVGVRFTSSRALELWTGTTAAPTQGQYRGALLAAGTVDPSVMYYVRMVADATNGGSVTAQVYADPGAAALGSLTATGLGFAAGTLFTGTDVGVLSPGANSMRVRVGDFAMQEGQTAQITAVGQVAGLPNPTETETLTRTVVVSSSTGGTPQTLTGVTTAPTMPGLAVNGLSISFTDNPDRSTPVTVTYTLNTPGGAATRTRTIQPANGSSGRYDGEFVFSAGKLYASGGVAIAI
jgi:hypothetical protein